MAVEVFGHHLRKLRQEASTNCWTLDNDAGGDNMAKELAQSSHPNLQLWQWRAIKWMTHWLWSLGSCVQAALESAHHSISTISIEVQEHLPVPASRPNLHHCYGAPPDVGCCQ